MSFAKRLAIFVLWSALTLYLVLALSRQVEPPKTVNVNLTNTDTIYQQIDSLEVISDTIKVYYEKKIQNYRILPTTQRVELFAERISR